MSRLFAGHGRAPAAIFVAAAVAAGLWWRSSVSRDMPRDPIELRDGEALTVALTGDSVLTRPMPTPGVDAAFDGVIASLHAASLAVTNLDQSVVDETVSTDGGRWPFASLQAAFDLRRAGIGVVSCANNHGLDYGLDGLRATRRLLQRAGLTIVGCGEDLGEARAAAIIGSTTPRRVAVVAVTVSAAAEVRATAMRGEIKGRPGVSAVRYSASVTADPATFDALRSVVAMRGGPVPAGDELQLAGAVIRKGAETIVQMHADESDVLDVVRVVEAARDGADVVIVALHNHEPSNRSDRPAEFVQLLARRLVDAGATLVVGHGPHQLRGVETYKGAAILYSLGDFIFHDDAIDFGVADVFEAGLDLFQQALGAGGGSPDLPPTRSLTDPVWWESAIAVATFDAQGLVALRLVPIDLRRDAVPAERGTPRLAEGALARQILDRLAALSTDLGTSMRTDNGSGVVDLRRTPPTAAVR